ncbi:MAG: FkbH like protein [Acidobacteria bacterium]|nr:FkbH like protein [Acidobacteriota bacterium]
MLMKHSLGWNPPVSSGSNVLSYQEEINSVLVQGIPSACRKLLKKICEDPSAQPFKVRIGVLRSFSLELLEDLLCLALLRWGIFPEFFFADFNVFESELLDPKSRLNQEHRNLPFDVLFLAWRMPDLVPGIWNYPSASNFSEVLDHSLARVRQIMETALSIAPVLALPLNEQPADSVLAGTRARQNMIISAHYSLIVNAAADLEPGFSMVDLNHQRNSISGNASIFDRKQEALCHQPFSNFGQIVLATALAKSVAPRFISSAKVLALDADNTLWGGIVGEDGVEGLQLHQDFPGNLYLKLQTAARILSENGFLLVLLSKNDEYLVKEVFEKNKDLPLNYDSFVASRVNWDNKANNLIEISEELNLGLDQFVFLDESAYERENMRALLPEVRVPETPDVLSMLDYLENGLDFLKVSITSEDLGRTQDYKAQKHRSKLEQQAQSVEEFLTNLQLEAEVQVWNKDLLPRIHQLLDKTNQFNLTTRRHSLAQLTQWLEQPNLFHGQVIRVKDRFGDQGIVGLSIVKKLDHDEWELDSFLLSCRALGRGVQEALLFQTLSDLENRGTSRVIGKYIPTRKNSQTASFYQSKGARKVHESAAEVTYQIVLEDFFKHQKPPAWISLR